MTKLRSCIVAVALVLASTFAVAGCGSGCDATCQANKEYNGLDKQTQQDKCAFHDRFFPNTPAPPGC